MYEKGEEMNILYISGSPRKKSNTDILLKLTMSITGGEFIKLIDLYAVTTAPSEDENTLF
ncbi:MAG: hypothetical protein XD65_1150 [Caldanaerobacter subterraneus]|jgi:multimeric flavodoxin WrbA|uniref:hypothetical protein n=1 Tax=unclassified Thermoanaerobacter TaxID=2636821 RepID=UPI0001A966B1|nr:MULTISPECIES: hypothetical protein [unclassified Thermoanaerobacter]KUJ89745.1 MAG: NADPH-dependent FMN reductase [Thermoanaerobacter thermocopriae]KUK34511.1 MAG: hypothetical protein XD65_1150 [Caldanaerobacter subterraneus]HAA81611.1 hypothetical protein [Thermoanaerobacter sp.]HCD10555.1 hypothetical protein [Thermoanaerobacter sp.]